MNHPSTGAGRRTALTLLVLLAVVVIVAAVVESAR